jgi:hypothetical protein
MDIGTCYFGWIGRVGIEGEKLTLFESEGIDFEMNSNNSNKRLSSSIEKILFTHSTPL